MDPIEIEKAVKISEVEKRGRYGRYILANKDVKKSTFCESHQIPQFRTYHWDLGMNKKSPTATIVSPISSKSLMPQ